MKHALETGFHMDLFNLFSVHACKVVTSIFHLVFPEIVVLELQRSDNCSLKLAILQLI